MQVLGIRWCTVHAEAAELAGFFDALGLPRQSLGETGEGFAGAVFPAGTSWIELWPEGPQMPAGTMLQVVVDNADAFAAHARGHGLEPEGPVDAHGERISFLKAPTGVSVAFQSRLEGDD